MPPAQAPTPCGDSRGPPGGLRVWARRRAARGWGTHAGLTPQLFPCFQVSGGRRPHGTPFRGSGDVTPSVGLGRVTGAQLGCHFLRTEPAQEVRVLQPPLGIHGHLAPQPVELAKKQKAFPGVSVKPTRNPVLEKAAFTWAGPEPTATQNIQEEKSIRPPLGGSLRKPEQGGQEETHGSAGHFFIESGSRRAIEGHSSPAHCGAAQPDWLLFRHT